MSDHDWTPEDVGKIAAKVQAAAWKAGYDTAKAETLADLRAKVEALRDEAMKDREFRQYGTYYQGQRQAYADVLALFDGKASDG